MFTKKIKMRFTNEELKIIIEALNSMRNRLLSEGRYTVAVDELLIKFCK